MNKALEAILWLGGIALFFIWWLGMEAVVKFFQTWIILLAIACAPIPIVMFFQRKNAGSLSVFISDNFKSFLGFILLLFLIWGFNRECERNRRDALLCELEGIDCSDQRDQELTM